MSHDLTTYLGGLAAFLASLSYVPQVRKAWPRGSTADLSMGMLVALTHGVGFVGRLWGDARRLGHHRRKRGRRFFGRDRPRLQNPRLPCVDARSGTGTIVTGIQLSRLERQGRQKHD
jgi:hypothetical protein